MIYEYTSRKCKEVFEEHANEIFSEAENRLHAQKGLMVWLKK
jgi:ornithine carbamoyltransferase